MAQNAYLKLGFKRLNEYVSYQIDTVFSFGNLNSGIKSCHENIDKFLEIVDRNLLDLKKDRANKDKVNFESLELKKLEELEDSDIDGLDFSQMKSLNNQLATNFGCDFWKNELKILKQKLHLGNCWL